MRSPAKAFRKFWMALPLGHGFIALAVGTTLSPLAFEVIRYALLEPSGDGVVLEAFSPARLAIIAEITARALWVTALAALGSVPIAAWIGQAKRPIVAPALTVLLITPFFVSDAVKAYAWAELIGTFRPSFPALPSPYDAVVPFIVLALKAVPVIVLTLAPAYSAVVERPKQALAELGLPSAVTARYVTFPALFPYLLGATMLALAFVFPATAELQFLGGALPNTVTTLMQSLLRTSVFEAELFAFSLIGVATSISYLVISALFGRLANMQRLLFRAAWLIPSHSQLAPSRRLYHILGPLLTFGIVLLMWLPIIETLVLMVTRCSSPAVKSCAAAAIDSSYWSGRVTDDLRTTFIIVAVAAAAGWVSAVAGICTVVFEAPKPGVFFWVVLVLLLPGDAVALGLAQASIDVGVQQGSIVLAMLAETLYVFPYCFLIGVFAGLGVSSALGSALRELGLSRLAIVLRRLYPIVAPLCASAALFGAILALNEYTRISYVGGDAESLAGYLVSELNAGVVQGNATSYVLSSALVFIGVCATLAVAVMTSRYRSRLD